MNNRSDSSEVQVAICFGANRWTQVAANQRGKNKERKSTRLDGVGTINMTSWLR
jgi:hypothetical protein